MAIVKTLTIMSGFCVLMYLVALSQKVAKEEVKRNVMCLARNVQ